MQILINNKFFGKEDSKINLFSDALMYGYGVFETLRTFRGKNLLKAGDHITRLINSAKQIDLQVNFSYEEIQNMLLQIIEKSEHELQRIKILALPGYLIVLSHPLKIDKNIYKGVTLKTVIHKRSFPEIKSTSYLDCLVNYNRAVKEGFFDALFIDTQNYVYECTRSNIFWIKNKKLFTRKNEVLQGITRNVVQELSHLPFQFINGKVTDFFQADEVFITNSINGVVPVVKVNETKISSGKPGKETAYLRNQFEKQVSKSN